MLQCYSQELRSFLAYCFKKSCYRWDGLQTSTSSLTPYKMSCLVFKPNNLKNLLPLIPSAYRQATIGVILGRSSVRFIRRMSARIVREANRESESGAGEPKQGPRGAEERTPDFCGRPDRLESSCEGSIVRRGTWGKEMGSSDVMDELAVMGGL
jgi:hypothetical protein